MPESRKSLKINTDAFRHMMNRLTELTASSQADVIKTESEAVVSLWELYSLPRDIQASKQKTIQRLTPVYSGGKTKTLRADKVFQHMERYPTFQAKDGSWKTTKKKMFATKDIIDLTKYKRQSKSMDVVDKYLKKKQEEKTKNIGLTKASILAGGRSAGLNITASDTHLDKIVPRVHDIGDGKRVNTKDNFYFVITNSSPYGMFARTKASLTRAVKTRTRLFMRSIKKKSATTLKKLTANYPGLTFNTDKFNE